MAKYKKRVEWGVRLQHYNLKEGDDLHPVPYCGAHSMYTTWHLSSKKTAGVSTVPPTPN